MAEFKSKPNNDDLSLIVFALDDNDMQTFDDLLLFVSNLDKFMDKYPETFFERYLKIIKLAEAIYKFNHK